MNLFAEIADTGRNGIDLVAGGVITITRKSSLPSDVNMVLKAIGERRPVIDLGGATLVVPPLVKVTAERLATWTFEPALWINVTVSKINVVLEVTEVAIGVAESKPAVNVRTSSMLHPNVLFIFDDQPESPPEPTAEQLLVGLRGKAVAEANVPVGKSQAVIQALADADSHGMTVAAIGRMMAVTGRHKSTRDACQEEASQIYAQLQEKGVVGTGLMFWMTVGQWILSAIRWYLYFRQKDTTAGK